MDSVNAYIFARAVHIFAVVLWIGGVAFVTTILIPSLKQIPDTTNRLELFEKLEGKFSIQARITTVLTVLSGVYLIDTMQIWHRFLLWEFWWMHLMIFVWFIFTLVLFVLEPWFLHDWFRKPALVDSNKTFRTVQLMHIILLSISLVTVIGAMFGAHGYRF